MNRVKINAPHKIRVTPRQFQEIASGRQNVIAASSDNYKVGDRITILEFDGKKFTGKDITGIITKSEDDLLQFRKFSINTQPIDSKNFEYSNRSWVDH